MPPCIGAVSRQCGRLLDARLLPPKQTKTTPRCRHEDLICIALYADVFRRLRQAFWPIERQFTEAFAGYREVVALRSGGSRSDSQLGGAESELGCGHLMKGRLRRRLSYREQGVKKMRNTPRRSNFLVRGLRKLSVADA